MAQQGSTQTLTATFYDAPGGALTDPTLLTLTIRLAGTVVVGPLSPPTVVKDGVGLYRYEWTIPLDAASGTYTATWSAVMPGGSEPSVGYETITVSDAIPGVPATNGCEWPMDVGCVAAKWEEFEPSVRERALALASSSLRRLVGYRVGVCPIKVRPVPQRGSCFVPYMGDGNFHPGMNVHGNWVNNCGLIQKGASCEIKLPGPIGRVDEVKVDGVVIPPTDYRVDNSNILVWQGSGECPFLLNQNLDLPDTEVGTFSVTYLNAYPVDANGARAVALLALEFAKACTSGKCSLPGGVVSVVRQGVSMELNTGVFPDGLTGIKEVDAYIGLWNPNNIRQEATVWSPDLPTVRQTMIGG